MPRPRKRRCVEAMPGVTYFKPRGVPLRFLEEVVLTVEELEAIRLKDLENLDGVRAAERMQVSRPTFQRILETARRKLADALVGGKALRIHGGDFEVTSRWFRCSGCQHQWQEPFGTGRSIDMTCPVCHYRSVHRIERGLTNHSGHRPCSSDRPPADNGCELDHDGSPASGHQSPSPEPTGRP